MTVVDRIREHAAPFLARPAIIQGDRVFSHGELYDRVDRLSHALSELGVRPPDCVMALLPNTHEAIETELAALSSGVVWITLTSRLTWGEVRGVVASCAPSLIVTDAAGLAKIRAGMLELPLPSLPPIVLTGHDVQTGDGGLDAPLGFEELLRDHAPRRATAEVSDEHPARLRYTSGTTGSAKAAVLPHRVYQAFLDNLLSVLPPLGPDDRALHAAPLTHGSGALVYPMLWAGAANVLESHFDVDATLSAIESLRITTMFTVPTILSRLVSAPSFAERDLSSLRSLIYGGAPMPEPQLRSAVQKIGRALMQIYGMSEAPWPITALLPSEHRPESARLRSVGKPTPACTVRIVDETGAPVQAGDVGEIQIQGRNVMQGYYLDDEATRAVLRDGWLSSGDLGYIDSEGYVFIVGRRKDVIISGGFNVYASEVEDTLCSDERVLEAAVVGLPHADWGEMVAAFVVAKPGAALMPADVDALVRSRLSGYKCPRRVEVLPELPKNPSGKILKRELIERFGREKNTVR